MFGFVIWREMLKKQPPATNNWQYFNYSYFSFCCNCLQDNPAESQFRQTEEEHQEECLFINTDLNSVIDV